VNRRDRQEAADLLRRLLGQVERGELTTDGPAAVTLVRRLEGAVIALDALHRRA
jgi:hypothetical protein